MNKKMQNVKLTLETITLTIHHKQLEDIIKSKTSFKVTAKRITYLDINFTRNLQDLYQ